MMTRLSALILLASSLFVVDLAVAATPSALLQHYQTEARRPDPAFTASAERGQAFFLRQVTRDGKQVSCATCHGRDPRQPGETRAFRPIRPLAPVANPERLTDAKKVEKWFRRNCDDVHARECTAAEKADVIAWLIRVK